MGNGRQKDYDDEDLILAIAAGNKSHSQIARELGLSPAMIHYIVKGKKRPELRPKIEAAMAEFRGRAHRLTGQLAAAAVVRLGQLISSESDARPDVQLRAAVEILKFALGTPFKAAPPADDQPDRLGEYHGGGLFEKIMTLPPETQGKIFELLGGPSPEESAAILQACGGGREADSGR